MVNRERYVGFEQALALTGLSAARFRFLEKEFGPYLALGAAPFEPSVYSMRQLAILNKIDHVLRREEVDLETAKARLARFIACRESGIWIGAVTSGKGGVGKTTMAVNLAVAMARLGTQPTLVDADFGCANAHLLLGHFPERDLHDLLRGDACLDEIMLDTGYGVRLVPGNSGASASADMSQADRERLAGEVRKLYYHTDALVVDTGSGISANVTRFLRLADDIIVVITPNIASCSDALGIIRVAAEKGMDGRINILVNRCRDEAEAREVYFRFHRVAAKLMSGMPWYLGHVPEDEHLEEAFQKGVPVTSLYPACRASRQIRHLARALRGERRNWKTSDRGKVAQLLAEMVV